MKQSDLIVPFVESVQDLCTTMLGCEDLQRGKVGVPECGRDESEITGIVGISGPDRGMVAISFPKKTALSMVSSFMGMEMTEMDSDVADALAEIVNIISGGAKPKLPHPDEQPFELGLPTVVNGNDYLVQSPSDSLWLEIPFTTEAGPFSIRITFESMKKSK